MAVATAAAGMAAVRRELVVRAAVAKVAVRAVEVKAAVRAEVATAVATAAVARVARLVVTVARVATLVMTVAPVARAQIPSFYTTTRFHSLRFPSWKTRASTAPAQGERTDRDVHRYHATGFLFPCYVIYPQGVSDSGRFFALAATSIATPIAAAAHLCAP